MIILKNGKMFTTEIDKIVPKFLRKVGDGGFFEKVEDIPWVIHFKTGISEEISKEEHLEILEQARSKCQN
jgi:hypothetical protein